MRESRGMDVCRDVVKIFSYFTIYLRVSLIVFDKKFGTDIPRSHTILFLISSFTTLPLLHFRMTKIVFRYKEPLILISKDRPRPTTILRPICDEHKIPLKTIKQTLGQKSMPYFEKKDSCC